MANCGPGTQDVVWQELGHTMSMGDVWEAVHEHTRLRLHRSNQQPQFCIPSSRRPLCKPCSVGAVSSTSQLPLPMRASAALQ